ncbi:MAG TPA: response regulator transcription factor [Candidatus Blautia avicola]|uniref:Stage 0 sporulation protein A homolog n=1 Tax=Candidatus Blautia avicola TaxID=2838483 RepID=A0A9D2QVC7_9FIRM|nr:response regulator transcription factor [Candidatus Blautia avicola]
MPTILVLEDDPELNRTISSVLERDGYRIFSAYSCKEAKEIAENDTLDMAVLDINLPDGDGFWFCRWLKDRNQVPVLFLSARDLEEDMLKGYDLGAEDYLTKPFSIKILQKKIALILSREPKNSNIYDDGFLRIDFELGKIQKGKEECPVTPTEYRILKKLIQNKGRLLTYSLLLDSLWEEGVQLMDKHALAVNINRLRKKIETEEHSYIFNVYGMGYIWK